MIAALGDFSRRQASSSGNPAVYPVSQLTAIDARLQTRMNMTESPRFYPAAIFGSPWSNLKQTVTTFGYVQSERFYPPFSKSTPTINRKKFSLPPSPEFVWCGRSGGNIQARGLRFLRLAHFQDTPFCQRRRNEWLS
jgi:hypothetical protein